MKNRFLKKIAVFITAAMVLSSTMTPVYAETDDSFINFTENGTEIVEGNDDADNGTETQYESRSASTEQDDVIWFGSEAKDTGVEVSSSYKESVQRQEDETGLKEKFTKTMTLDSMPGVTGENATLTVQVNENIEDGTVMVDWWSGFDGSVTVSIDGDTSDYTPGSVINFEKDTKTIDFIFNGKVSLSAIPDATVTGTVDKGTDALCDYAIDYQVYEKPVTESADIEDTAENESSNDKKDATESEKDVIRGEEKEEENKDNINEGTGDTENTDMPGNDNPEGTGSGENTDTPGGETPSTPSTPDYPSTPEEPDTPADPGKLVLPTITADKTTIYVNGDSTDGTQQKDTMSKVSVDGFEYPAVSEDKRTETVIDKPAYDEPIMRDVYVCTICGEKFETPKEASEHCSTAHQDDQTISPSYEKEEEISGYKHHDAVTHEEGAEVKVVIEIEVDSSLSPVLWQEPDFENADVDIKIKESEAGNTGDNTVEDGENGADTGSVPSVATITLTYKDLTKPIKQTKPLVINTVGNIPEQSTENDIVKTASVKGTISSSIEESPYTIAPVSISVIKEKADDGTTVDPGVDPGTGGDDISDGGDSGEGTVTPVPVNPTPVEPEPAPVEEEVQEEEKEPTVVEEIVDNVLNFVSENSDVVSTTSMATTATRSGATATKELIDRARRNTTETSQIEDVVENEKTDGDVDDKREESRNGGSLEDEIKTQTEESEKGETVVQTEGDDNTRLPSDTKRFIEGGIIIGLVLALGGIASYIVFLKKNDDDDEDDDDDGNSENSGTPPVVD